MLTHITRFVFCAESPVLGHELSRRFQMCLSSENNKFLLFLRRLIFSTLNIFRLNFGLNSTMIISSMMAQNPVSTLQHFGGSVGACAEVCAYVTV